MTWGYAAALAGMLLYGVASVAQAYAAQRASGAQVLRHPAYVLGVGGDLLAWVCSLVALASLPLFVVQSLLAGSLAVTVLLAAPVLGLRPRRGDLVAVAVVSLGLLLVSASPAAEAPGEPPGWFAVAAGVAVLALAGGAAASYRRGGSTLLAVEAGLAFSLAALGARAIHLQGHDWSAALAQPVTWAVLVAGVLGAVLYARALETGAVGPATAVLWVVEVVVPGAVGVVVLGDAVRPGWSVPALVGVGVAVAGCVVLARSPAQG